MLYISERNDSTNLIIILVQKESFIMSQAITSVYAHFENLHLS